MHCERCGKPVSRGSIYCYHCGARVAREGDDRRIKGDPEGEPNKVPDNHSGNQPREELIIFRTRPVFFHVGLIYLFSALLSLCVAAIGGFFGLPLKGVFFCAAFFFLIPLLRHLRRNRTSYTLTGTQVEIKSGLLSRESRNIPLRSIEDVTVRASLLERLLGSGDVLIDSASTAGKILLRHIQNPRRHADLILGQLHRWD
jgi:membrane protein YdbS with pleckstrin-like domain